MFYVQCVQCGSVVEIPAEDVVTKGRAPWSAAECLECDSSFHFEDTAVQFVPDAESVL